MLTRLTGNRGLSSGKDNESFTTRAQRGPEEDQGRTVLYKQSPHQNIPLKVCLALTYFYTHTPVRKVLMLLWAIKALPYGMAMLYNCHSGFTFASIGPTKFYSPGGNPSLLIDK